MTTTLTDAYGVTGLPILNDNRTANSRSIAEPIAAENCWRGPGLAESTRAVLTERVVVSRWTRQGIEAVEHAHQSTGDHHTIGINLRSTALTYRSGRMLYEGKVTPGAVHVTNPGPTTTALFPPPSHLFLLYFPHPLL